MSTLSARNCHRRRYASRRERGLCVECGAPAEGTVYCRSCLDVINARNKKRKARAGKGMVFLASIAIVLSLLAGPVLAGERGPYNVSRTNFSAWDAFNITAPNNTTLGGAYFPVDWISGPASVFFNDTNQTVVNVSFSLPDSLCNGSYNASMVLSCDNCNAVNNTTILFLFEVEGRR